MSLREAARCSPRRLGYTMLFQERMSVHLPSFALSARTKHSTGFSIPARGRCGGYAAMREGILSWAICGLVGSRPAADGRSPSPCTSHPGGRVEGAARVTKIHVCDFCTEQRATI